MSKACTPLLFALLAVLPLSSPAQLSMSIQVGKNDTTIVGLPLSADVTVHTVRHLANGMAVDREVKGRFYRSADGVERSEGIFPSTDPASPEPTTIAFIIDHAKRTSIVLNSKLKTATEEELPPKAAVTISILPLPQPQGADRQIKLADVTSVDLGKQTMGLLDVRGRLVKGTIPAGKIGNDQPLPVTNEIWVSPQYKLVVRQSEQNPLTGDRSVQFTNIRLDEPDPTLFEIPPGYAVKQRTLSPLGGGVPPALKESMAPPQPRTQQIQDALSASAPEVKNNLAYALAQNGDHLADAQLLSQQALEMEEQQVADAVSGADTDASFDQMVFLSRYWDTAGYVLYRAHKLTQAEAYLRAAWELNPNSLFASHLGFAYEAQKKQSQAIAMYRMAFSAHPSPGLVDRLNKRLAGLGVPGGERLPIDIVTPLPTLALQPSAEAAVVDIVLSQNHPPAIHLVEGNDLNKPLTDAIASALASFLPDNGPEFVIRRARVICTADANPACVLHFINTREFTAAEQARRNALRAPLP